MNAETIEFTDLMPDPEILDVLRDIRWRDWKDRGGCGISDYALFFVNRHLGSPQAHWPETVTLGEICSAFFTAAREIARFALTNADWFESAFGRPIAHRNPCGRKTELCPSEGVI